MIMRCYVLAGNSKNCRLTINSLSCCRTSIGSSNRPINKWCMWHPNFQQLLRGCIPWLHTFWKCAFKLVLLICSTASMPMKPISGSPFHAKLTHCWDTTTKHHQAWRALCSAHTKAAKIRHFSKRKEVKHGILWRYINPQKKLVILIA